MATVSRGEITITNVDDGKPSYTHTAYAWSADGTDRFTTSYPGTNELRLAQSKFFAYQGSTVSRTEGVAVPEWGATDAIRHVISGGTVDGISAIMRTGSLVKANVKYVHSVYIKNQGTTKIRIDNNLSQSIDVDPGETKRVIFNPAGNTAGVPAKQFVLRRLNASDVQDFILWRPKIEESETTATIWTPSPYDDFSNAYPTFAGSYVDDQPTDSEDPADYTWQRILGQGGESGDSAPLISLSGATQAITVDKDGKITPASSFAVTGTAVNTSISNWTYSLNGGNFGSAVPTGVTRSGNTVTIDPTKAVFDTFTIKAADATVSDVFTISRIKDGGEGPPGSDAYTVFLTNESYTFAGSTTAALAGSTTTEVIVYKGINKITPTSITVGTKPTGLSSSVSGSIITLTATTALVSKSGTVPITIIADGKTFTKQFSYALSLQGGKGDPGDPGKGVSAEEISYAISQDGTTPPTSGWSGTRPTPKAGWYMWTRTRFKYTDNTYSAYFYLVAQQGKDAIIISATPPTNPSKEDLWQDPNDATSTVYKWDGTQWIRWGISIDNLIVSNVQIENGVFKRVEGALIVGSEFRNPYTVTYNDGSVSTGTVVMEGSAITNSGVNKTSSGVRRYAYEDAWSPGNLTMSRYDDDKVGDQNKLLAALGLTYNRLTLTDLQTGFAGSLTAEMLFDTGYVSLPVLKGSGAIRVKRYMGRYMIWFDTFIWNGSGGGGIGDAVIQLPAEFNPGRQQMLEVPIWSTAPGRADRFQLNTDGRLYKLSNNSGGTYFRTFTEIF